MATVPPAQLLSKSWVLTTHLWGASAAARRAMLIVDEELEGFFVDSEDDEPTSRRLSLAGSRTDVWDDEDDGLSQCPTSEVRSLPAFTASHSRPIPEAADLGNRSGVRRATRTTT